MGVPMSGSMSGERKRSVAAWPKLPRLSPTLPFADLTQRSECALKFGLRAGSRSAFTCTDSMIARKEAVYFVSRWYRPRISICAPQAYLVAS
jgi:hypothetical protein